MQIIGHLGKDAIVKEVNGKNVINFSVAHSEKYKNAQGEQVTKSTWAECAYWTDKTGVVPYLVKGAQVYVEGQPEADAYTSKEGKAMGTLRLRVGNIQLLGGGQAAQDNAAAPVANNAMSQPAPELPQTGDLPF